MLFILIQAGETLQEQKKKDRMSEFDKKEYYIKVGV